MIAVTRLDGSELIINAGHITTVEKTPDTVIELTTGERIMVKETPEQVVQRVTDFRREVLVGLCRLPSGLVALPHPSKVQTLDDPKPVPESEGD